LCFDYLDAPVGVLGSRNWITPAYELEKSFFAQSSWFLDMIHERIQPLAGYVPGQNFTDAEMIRRAKLGSVNFTALRHLEHLVSHSIFLCFFVAFVPS